eukprot:476303-Prymnesium_polylepis.1
MQTDERAACARTCTRLETRDTPDSCLELCPLALRRRLCVPSLRPRPCRLPTSRLYRLSCMCGARFIGRLPRACGRLRAVRPGPVWYDMEFSSVGP